MTNLQNHYRRPEDKHPLCGKPHPRWDCWLSVDRPDEVTCKRCLKRLAELHHNHPDPPSQPAQNPSAGPHGT